MSICSTISLCLNEGPYQTDMNDAVLEMYTVIRDGLALSPPLFVILWFEIWKFYGSTFCGLSFAVFSEHGAFYVCHMLVKLNTLDILETSMSQKEESPHRKRSVFHNTKIWQYAYITETLSLIQRNVF